MCLTCLPNRFALPKALLLYLDSQIGVQLLLLPLSSWYRCCGCCCWCCCWVENKALATGDLKAPPPPVIWDPPLIAPLNSAHWSAAMACAAQTRSENRAMVIFILTARRTSTDWRLLWVGLIVCYRVESTRGVSWRQPGISNVQSNDFPQKNTRDYRDYDVVIEMERCLVGKYR